MTMVCCSTTWSPGVQKFAQSCTRNPVHVFIGTVVPSTTQKIRIVEEKDKFEWVCVPSVSEIAKLEQLYLS
jgi:superfamily II DNA/RNA helicase